MADPKLYQLPLRELFTTTERLLRELQEHLEQSVHPKVVHLDELTASWGNREGRNAIRDAAVRQQAAALLSSDEFTQSLVEKVLAHLDAIDRGTNKALNN
jgi:DNA polymerase/3'-5' exonuclease PolX